MAALIAFSLKDRVSTGKAILPGTSVPSQNNTDVRSEIDSTLKTAAWIDMVIIRPENPSTLDALQANVHLYPTAPEPDKIAYQYEWFINGRLVKQDADGFLSKGVHKKFNVVTVRVTPTYGDQRGAQYMSAPIVIGNAPPDLSLNASVIHKDGSYELQLNGEDPDGDVISYALEDPALQGMTVEKSTGKIIWSPSSAKIGTYQFRASVADSSGMRTAKTFQFTLDSK